jgi:hypothetical protein
MLEQLFRVQLPQQILIFRPEPSWHSPALEFKLKNLSYIHSLNKMKQPFYNLLQCCNVKGISYWEFVLKPCYQIKDEIFNSCSNIFIKKKNKQNKIKLKTNFYTVLTLVFIGKCLHYAAHCNLLSLHRPPPEINLPRKF